MLSRYSKEARAGRLSLITFILFSLIAFSLFRLQVIKGGYYRGLSEKNRLRLITLEAPRGRILDRDGRELAGSRLSFNCTAILREKPSKIRKSFETLASILGEEVETLEKRYRRAKAGFFHSIVLAEDIPQSQAMEIEEQVHLLNGIMVETRPVRTYPLADAAAHLTGYIGPQRPEESEELELAGYRPTDWLGREGLEKKYEDRLRGVSGGLQLEVNSRGQYLKVLGVKEPHEGQDLRLSVDSRLQEYVQKRLGQARGAVAVMDLSSGGLLCLNSSPSFDPNLFSSARGRKGVGVYLQDERSPMLDRAIQGQYPPGSIFKGVTALAALEARKIRTSARYQCNGFVTIGGKKFRCWKKEGHGSQGMDEAFAHSCDVFFYMAGLAAGPDLIHRKALEMGFGLATGLDLPGERSGLAPSRGWKSARKKSPWYDGDTLNYSIGQGYLLVTPMQALVMVSAIATGERIHPHLVEAIGPLKVGKRLAVPFQATPDYLQAVRHGFEEVVRSDSGTGRLVRIQGLKIAGKTGTAQTHKEEDHAWYVGYAPYDRPKVAFVVFLEFGGHGGVEAAQVAKDVMLKVQELGYA